MASSRAGRRSLPTSRSTPRGRVPSTEFRSRKIELRACPTFTMAMPRFVRSIRWSKELGNLLNRFLRCRKPDAHGRYVRELVEPLQREHQMRAALVVGHGVNLVDDHGLDVAQDAAALLCRQAGCRATPASSPGCAADCAASPRDPSVRRVARANGGANRRHQQSALAGQRLNLAQAEASRFF